MPNALRVILWSVFSLGMLVLAVMAFWVFLIILGIVIIARLIYSKLFQKGKGSFTIHTYTIRPDRHSNNSYHQDIHQESRDQEYTTVIDAENQDREYKISKIK